MARRPTFSDYTTRDPGAPAAGGKPSVNLRYTAPDVWQVYVGGRVDAGASPQMKPLCADLVTRPFYSGQNFSAGDGEIFNIAQPSVVGTGSVPQWVQWCVSHHLAFVSRQIQNDAAI